MKNPTPIEPNSSPQRSDDVSKSLYAPNSRDYDYDAYDNAARRTQAIAGTATMCRTLFIMKSIGWTARTTATGANPIREGTAIVAPIVSRRHSTTTALVRPNRGISLVCP